MTLEFFVSGEPAAQARHRTRVLGKRSTAQGKSRYMIQHYHPKASKCSEWREAVAYMARKKMSEPGMRMLEGPLQAVLIFHMKRPKKPLHPIWHITKPDGDNLEKAILDSMNGIAYKDDCIVADTRKQKRYGDVPGVHIILKELEG